MALKVAIVGLAPSGRAYVPWNDPAWEKWGLPWDWEHSRMDRCFEIHSPDLFTADLYPKDYSERLKDCPMLYLQQAMSEYPQALAYPLDAVIADVGIDYFQSSVAYMLGLAILEGADEISIYGVEMADNSEYAYQKPNCEYLIGLAVGRGIKVSVAGPLCKYTPAQLDIHYPTRYGWDA
jgi:hypothetical protein